jgi:hypothetical protein
MSHSQLDLTPYEKFLRQSLEDEKKRLDELNERYAKSGLFKKMQIKRQLDLVNQNIELLAADLKNYESGLRWLREPSKERDEIAESLKPVPIEALTAQAPKPATPAVGTRPPGTAPPVGRPASVGQPVGLQSQPAAQPRPSSSPQQAPRVGTPVIGKPVGTPIGKPLPSQGQQTQPSPAIQQQETKTDQSQPAQTGETKPPQSAPRVGTPIIGKPIGTQPMQAPRVGTPIGTQAQQPKKQASAEEKQEEERKDEGASDSTSESQSS